MELDLNSLPIGLLAVVVFFARVLDVSIGTVRTIATVQGRVGLVFVLGLFEVTIWLVVIAAVLNTVLDRPWLLVFYAFGFSTGNVVGIMLEKKLALGHAILRIFTARLALEIAASLRENGFRVTRYEGEGARGPVSELHIICERRRMPEALELVQRIDPDVFYVCETPTGVRNFGSRSPLPPSSWFSLVKRK